MWNVSSPSVLYWGVIVDRWLPEQWGWMWILGSPAVDHNKQADHEIPDVSTSFCLRLLDLPGANVHMVDGRPCPPYVGNKILTL